VVIEEVPDLMGDSETEGFREGAHDDSGWRTGDLIEAVDALLTAERCPVQPNVGQIAVSMNAVDRAQHVPQLRGQKPVRDHERVAHRLPKWRHRLVASSRSRVLASIVNSLLIIVDRARLTPLSGIQFTGKDVRRFLALFAPDELLPEVDPVPAHSSAN
jgi:hypothetical protein